MKALSLIFISCFSITARPGLNNANIRKHYQKSPVTLLEDCAAFNRINTKIRDAQLPKEQAIRLLRSSLAKIKQDFYEMETKDLGQASWHFPLQGYDSKAIGGVDGSGYIASKYDYFDGNRHLGHPAHDIFIRDRNQDCRDDRTNKEVKVVSITGGVVIAADTIWDITSDLRGGKYIYIYDPYANNIFYYAHNNRLFAGPGDMVTPGQVIATVGRTGINASKKRSPTHLHIMQLILDSNNYPRPADCYKNLIKAKVGKDM